MWELKFFSSCNHCRIAQNREIILYLPFSPYHFNDILNNLSTSFGKSKKVAITNSGGNTMTNKELLIRHIDLLSEKAISSLLDALIRYGHKCGKQRFFCRSCGKTFVPTTHTIMSNSHFSAEVWREVIKDTVHGNAIDYTAQRIGCSHQAVFDMRHKVLILQTGQFHSQKTAEAWCKSEKKGNLQ